MGITSEEEFQQKCQQWGWRCTAQRLAIFQFLVENHAHPDVDTVWLGVRQKLPSITRETVYRILNEFCDHGLIERVDHLDTARYDSRTGPHGHFICQQCGKIGDFAWPSATQLPGDMPLAAVKHMEIRIVGLCPECAAKLNKTKEAEVVSAPKNQQEMER